MHSILSGIVAFFMGITAMFHHGAPMPTANQTPSVAQASASGQQASPGGMRRRGGMNLPAGEKPFFGTVTNVAGSTLTVSMQGGFRRGNSSSTPPPPQTLTIDLASTTTYSGGSQSDIAINQRIAGVGKTNSDGSITAIQVQINPPQPSGFPRNRNANQ